VPPGTRGGIFRVFVSKDKCSSLETQKLFMWPPATHLNRMTESSFSPVHAQQSQKLYLSAPDSASDNWTSFEPDKTVLFFYLDLRVQRTVYLYHLTTSLQYIYIPVSQVRCMIISYIILYYITIII
jgi:hypothetical protein